MKGAVQLIIETDNLTDFAVADPNKPTVLHAVVDAVLACHLRSGTGRQPTPLRRLSVPPRAWAKRSSSGLYTLSVYS